MRSSSLVYVVLVVFVLLLFAFVGTGSLAVAWGLDLRQTRAMIAANDAGTVPCPGVALSAITDTETENGYTCVTVDVTLGKVVDLDLTPPRYAVYLSDRGIVVQGVWAGPREALQEGARVTVRGAVVRLGEWGVWMYAVKPRTER